MGNEVTYTILRNNHEVTICCEEMGNLVITGRAEPIEQWWEEGDDWGCCLALDLVGDGHTCLIIMHYCPNCGTKVQLKEPSNG